jgi:Spy/CpxP family protein refolding chaperone
VNKPKLWIALALVLVFAAGVVVGAFGGRWLLAKRPSDRRPDNAERYPSQERWAKELGLTAEQQTKIREIFKQNDGLIKELRSDYYKHIGEMRDSLRKDIDAVLTPEQRQKMAVMIQKMEQRRREFQPRDKRGESPTKENLIKEKQGEKETDHRSGGPGGSRGSRPGSWPF